MHRLTVVTCALAVVAAVAAPLRGRAQSLPTCPTVNASLVQTIDTKIAKPGDVFRFTTLAPVTLGTLNIAEGTGGAGIIEVLDHSKGDGQPGYLILNARYLALADGTHVPVAFVPGTNGRSFAAVGAGSSNAPGFLGFIPYYVSTAASIYNFFHHGKDAAVTAGTTLPLVVGDGIESGTCAAPVASPGSNIPAPHY